MNIDLTKYFTNKDVTISNEDFNMEKLQKDLYKGYIKESEVEKPDYSGYVAKADFDKLQTDYSALETNYNNTIKTLNDTNDKMARVSLESKLVRKGFEEKDFDEVVKLRNSLYAEEKDDQKAVDSIAEKFKNTYFANTNQNANQPSFTSAPNESGFKGNRQSQNDGGRDIKITRSTSLRDMLVPKN